MAGVAHNTRLGDGGLATLTELFGPSGVAVDTSGNILIAAYKENRVRMVTKSSGIISTAAGDGTRGYSGDGGLATLARLDNPYSVDVDVLGNIYIAEYGGCRIRMVTTSTGIISTVAGNSISGYSGDEGLATSAKLKKPSGVAVDASGNIYIGDAGNNRIRMVTKSTGIITTVAGSSTSGYSGDGGLATSARLSFPSGITFDNSGNLYIADCENNCVRVVAKSTGIISTVAGNGTSGYSGDGGLATSALLNKPNDVAVDVSGNIFIADGNRCIRMVAKRTGVISTLAGGTYGYSGDGGLATLAAFTELNSLTIDVSGNIYVADYFSNRIRMVTKSTGIISTVAGDATLGYIGDGGQATSAKLYFPSGMTFDASGNIYISDCNNHRIRMISKSTGIISTVAGKGDGSYYDDGYSGDEGLATSAKLKKPSGVAVDASGNIYIGDAGNNRIRMVTKSTGIITTVAGSSTSGYSGDGGLATSARLSFPSGITFDNSGNLYIADCENNCVRVVAKSTGIISTVAGNGNRGYSGDGGLATSARLSLPSAVIFDPSGNMFIADSSNNRVRMVTSITGTISTVAGTGTSIYSGDGGLATSASLKSPAGIALDASGNLYIADSGNSRIRMVTKSTGIISTVAGNSTSGYSGDGGLATLGQLNNPIGIAIDASGIIYVGDARNNRIRALLLAVPTALPTTRPSSIVTPTRTRTAIPSVASSVSSSSALHTTRPTRKPTTRPTRKPTIRPTRKPTTRPTRTRTAVPGVASTVSSSSVTVVTSTS